MKRIFILMFGILMTAPSSLYCQTTPIGAEDFDGTVTFIAAPTNSWTLNSVYYLPGTSATNPKSMLGLVPTQVGNSTTLTTPTYNCAGYDYVLLRFNHICKISPYDIVKVEYRINMGGGMGTWDSLPVGTYLGSAFNFQRAGFSAASYPEWEASDSSVFPTQNWWKEEVFDLTGYVNQFTVQFRFVITHGQVAGTHASYGWLIDNFQLLGSSESLIPPTVEFVQPLVKGTVFGAGPWEINAKVATNTKAPLLTPWLKYTVTNNSTPFDDSVLMTLVSQNDALWKAEIPQFTAGSEVTYSITVKDTLGNATTTTSGYTIVQGNKNAFILQDGGGNTNSAGNNYVTNTPFIFSNYVHCRSMTLYPASEMSIAAAGDITAIALRVANAGQGAIPVKIWLKTVPASKTTWDNTDNIPWATLTQDAALVYDKAFNFNTLGWMDMELDNSFYYNGVDNLVVMFEQDCSVGGNGSNCYYANNASTNYPTFHRSTTQTNRFWIRSSNTDGTTPTILPDRPDLRINMTSSLSSNSAATHSIDINDIIVISPSSNVPVAVTVKNRGSQPLSSVNIAYSVNGVNQGQKTLTFNPALAWDFNYKDVLGTYNPKLNDYDTVKVWVSNPNNTTDATIWDDALTKVVYGSSDIVMNFVEIPQDTMYTTGPHEITAEIYSRTGTPITPFLYVRSIFGGVTTYDTVPMINTSGNLWKVNIPQKVFDSDVHYAVKMTDILSNPLIIEDSLYIKRRDCTTPVSNLVLQYHSSTSGTATAYPFVFSAGYSRSMLLYPVDGIDAIVKGSITKIALNVRRVAAGSFPMKIWLKTVPASKTTWDATADNIDWNDLIQDATLVYDGDFYFNALGWVDIPLTTPYLYLHTDNLVVMFEQNCGSTSGGTSCVVNGTFASNTFPTFHFSTTATAKFWLKSSSTNPPTTSTNLTINASRPDIRLEVIPKCSDTNSVELVSIDSPVETGLMQGNSYPIRVSLRNKGIKNLTSCTIGYKLNGVVTTVSYSGNIAEDIMDTVIIGAYHPVALKEDTILVWVSLPNGEIDSTLYDDTLMIVRLGCSAPISGIVQVGAGKTYTSINQLLKSIRNCGVSGDITIELTGTFDENVDLTDFATYMKGYNLTITSAGNNADNAVIEPLTGAGITLSNMRNLTIKAITVRLPGTTARSAILFGGACRNITIRDCKLILDTTNASSATAISGGAIYKNQNTGVADSIFVVNNLLDGGDAGFYFYGGTSSTLYGTHVVFDSNTVKNNRIDGIYFQYTDFISCSYNTILSRTVNAATSWNPLDVNYSNGPVTYNRIIKRQATTITGSRGIYSYYHNYYLTSVKGLIANNEIIHTDMPSGTGIYAGIYANYSKTEILHNSIYMSGNREIRAIYITNASNNLDIMNNNIVILSPTGYPFYLTTSSVGGVYNIDYNNIYGSAYIGYFGSAAIADMATWRIRMPSDLHSVRVLTPFADDPPSNLKPISYKSLSCPLIATVSDDIEKVTRTNTTAMGAYTLPVYKQDLTLLQIPSWLTTLVDGRTVQVNVDISNTGTDPITDVTFGWSINDVLQSDITWTPTTPLTSSQQANNIPVGTFQAQVNDDSTCHVVVWIKSVNGQTEVATWNDTLFASANFITLSEFVTPSEDTLSMLSFEVNAKINDISGAPVTPPMLYLETIVGSNAYHIYDSVQMAFTGGVWVAMLSKQYYQSNVIYSLSVSDTMGNTSTIKDTVYIKYPDFGRIDVTIIGTGREGGMSSAGGFETPLNPDYGYNWSRQLYLFNEVCPSNSPFGTYISKIAWESNSISGIFNNQTCYMRAVDDITIGTSYLDPLDTSTHLQKVWTGSLPVYTKSWAEITLDVPFYLPYGKNLEIIWHNENGIALHLFTQYWYQTATPGNVNMSISSSRSDVSLPTTAGVTPKAYRTNLKVTTEDGAAFEAYKGNDLGLVAIASPINSVEVTCLPDFAPVRVTLRNLGENTYDFSTDSISLHAEIIDPYQTEYTLSTIINSGSLVSSEMRAVELSPSFPLMDAGQYKIKIWLENSIDQIAYDDTLFYTYESGRAALPVEDDFSGSIISDQFINRSIIPVGGETWEPYTDPTSQILPPEGNGMLRYVGSYGSMAQLKTRQLDLYRVVDPKLVFWYYHDNSASDLDNSYTEVSVVVDNIPIPLRTLFRKGAATGWVKDSIDLTPYINAQCVYVQFEAMNKYDSQSAQYLGLISITSTPDLSVSSILISPDVAVCDFENRELSVVVTTTMNQAIDFSIDEPDLEVQVGSQTFTYPLRHKMGGSSSDTISIQSNLDLTGITHIKAYLTVPVDRYAANDTANLVIDIQPQLSITVRSLTGGVNCFPVGTLVGQEVTIENIGNVDLSGIELELQINAGNDYSETLKESGTISIKADSSMTYFFESKYTVPEEATYQVKVVAYLCGSVLAVGVINDECADLHDVALTGLVSPATSTDRIGSAETISVTIENKDVRDFENITLIANIEDGAGNKITRMGNISRLEALSSHQFAFSETYTVPADSVYYIWVYVNKVDNNQKNDTLFRKRYTNVGISPSGETNVFTLGQNIPNPATNSTRIDYSIPEAGEVVFHVHNMTGQLLYSKTIEAPSGTNTLELNTSTFAAGVYYYSIEYKGQKRVKRMGITK